MNQKTTGESRNPEANRKISASKSNMRQPSMISPNPIMIHTSGIEGTFDIQRIQVKITTIYLGDHPYLQLSEEQQMRLKKEPRAADNIALIRGKLHEWRKTVEFVAKSDPSRLFHGQCDINTGTAIIKGISFSCSVEMLKN